MTEVATAVDPWAFGWEPLIGLLQLLAVVVAAFVGYVSVRTWQAERLDRRRAEIAEQVLTALYEAPEKFRSIRSPFSFGGEGSTRKAGENETLQETERLNHEYVPFERINSEKDYFVRVGGLRAPAKAYFGASLDEQLEAILKVRWEIIVAARMLATFNRTAERRNYRTDAQWEEHQEQINKHEAAIWDHGENDELASRIAAAVTAGEGICLPLLGQRATPKYLIDWLKRIRSSRQKR